MNDRSPENAHAAAADDIDILAGEYVLGTLSAAERHAVERRAAGEPALREAIDAWESRLQPYTELAPPLTPSPGLWSRIERSLQPVPAERRSLWQRAWHSLHLWRGVGLAAAAASLALSVLLLAVPESAAPRYLVVLTTPQHTQAGWVVQAASAHDIALVPLGTFELPQGKTLEFWTKADDWSGPVSLGLVRPGQTLHLSPEDLPPLQPNQLFELTLENAGGSPLGRPTGPIQFIGRAISL
ncbi:anti-sigma factor [Salinicola sp. JS01]|uniref:anti-sigma factor n=1 Tax=Salinicola sp. JS01 TaxID=3050071 RepID=UPI00255C0A9A|nr:anti-sigma factor [Salinicola sp. JS01]WIX31416.1 anti-sigma factor [Salinicola sp. JS01]